MLDLSTQVRPNYRQRRQRLTDQDEWILSAEGLSRVSGAEVASRAHRHRVPPLKLSPVLLHRMWSSTSCSAQRFNDESVRQRKAQCAACKSRTHPPSLYRYVSRELPKTALENRLCRGHG